MKLYFVRAMAEMSLSLSIVAWKRSQRNSICVKDFCNLEEESKC